MKVIFCVPGNNFSSEFVKSWTALIAYCHREGIEYKLSFAVSPVVYYVRAMCLGGDVLKGVKQKPFNGEKYDYILWIDSDIIFTVNDFKKLISHGEDIVGGWYRMRSQNISNDNPTACGKWDLEHFKKYGTMPFHTINTIRSAKRNIKGLVEVDFNGLGFVLVKNGVFESIDYPWFEPKFTELKEGGRFIRDFCSEDVSFCLSAKAKGFKLFVDPLIKVGHEKSIVM